MNTNKVLGKLTEVYRIKYKDAYEIRERFESGFNTQRLALRKDSLERPEINRILCDLINKAKERRYNLHRFKKLIHSFGNKDADYKDPLYLAEKYELYNKFVERFKIDLPKAIDWYLRFRDAFNKQKWEVGERMLTWKQMDKFVGELLNSYKTIDEFIKDTGDLVEGEGELMKLVEGNPLEDLLI